VVMNFWATWCSPCRKEFPALVTLYSGNADRGLVVLGVDLQESPEIVGRFADEFGATFPIVIDRKGDVAAQYRLLGLPLTMFIDSSGILRAQHVGVLTEEILEEKLADAFFTIERRP
jgi:cytochrome c biogenesis protein CcmG/thiol:disulfide interchange protein DsbE